MSQSEQQLDFLLYAWLREVDDRSAELRFQRYFRTAFPMLCRYVRSMRVEASTAEDIAQQALIRFFAVVGIQRRTASEHLLQAAANLRAVAAGELHIRRVARWKRRLSNLHAAALSFCVPAESELRLSRELGEQINGQIDLLRDEGLNLLAEVRAHVLGAPANASEANAFIESTHAICTNLPKLAIPSNALLFTIAKRQFLDHLRKKRLLAAHRLDEIVALGDDENIAESGLDGAAAYEAIPVEMSCAIEEAGDSPTEPAERRALESRYRDFVNFLRAPLTRAEHALAAAATRGNARSERARMQALQAKFDRLMAVLGSLRESPQPNEEEIARKLALTRNQVKYVIERIRQEFNHFFPEMARETRGRRKRQGAEYQWD